MPTPQSGPKKKNGTATAVQIPPMTQAEIDKAMQQARAVVEAEAKSVTPSTEKISPPRMAYATVTIVGTSPYVQHAFSSKAQQQMEETQRAGTQARSRKKREARDFEAGYRAAMHISREGWHGIPATAIRNAMISACRLVDFVMTRAKLTVFVIQDGYDAEDASPLIKIEGLPKCHKGWGRNANGGTDLRWRPMWDEGWHATVKLRWDLGQFSAADVFNLLMRAGMQVGIGEGRADSPKSNGLGWGFFEIDGPMNVEIVKPKANG
jgi:hypothetical protein